jgi:hypothetical protein
MERDNPSERCPADVPYANGACPAARCMPDKPSRGILSWQSSEKTREILRSRHRSLSRERVLLSSPHVMSTTRVMSMMARSLPTPLAARRGVVVGRSSGWEEDHVVVITKRHELQAPEPDHCAETKWSCHPKLTRNGGCDAQMPPTWCANCRYKKRWF